MLTVGGQSPPAQLVDIPTLALGRPAGARRAQRGTRLTDPRWFRRRQVLVEPAGGLAGTTAIVENENAGHAPSALRQRHLDDITRTDETRGLGRVVVHVDLAAGAGGRGQAARLEEARRPQPLVDAQRRRRLHPRDGIIGADQP